MSNHLYEKIGDPLAKLMKECGCVIQACYKYKMFGSHNYHPNDQNKTPNYRLVLNEIEDLEKRIDELKIYLKSNVCSFEKDGICYAEICTKNINCGAKNEKGFPKYDKVY
ncbi:MAG: hypothetical protein GX864_03470 [Mollicutes bacterium]|jgi:hypothetical protein|nr:hypothetical protein [Mollicutes bacterium]